MPHFLAMALLAGLASLSFADGAADKHAASVAPAPSVTAAQAREVVEALATELERDYVFPDVGARYASMLRGKAAAGAYATAPTHKAFGQAVTADLHALQRDGHLRLIPPAVAGEGGKRRIRQAPLPPITRTGWITDGVAYIGFSEFTGDADTLAALARFLDAHRTARTLVVDVRGHRGGEIDEIDLLLSRLYSQATPLVQMDSRVAVEAVHGPEFREGPALVRITGPEGIIRRQHSVLPLRPADPLAGAAVYLLTDGKTASAGEHLAFALKRTGRATLVGESTYGAGHFGFTFSLPHGYTAFIPTGRTFDPLTGESWEGDGVAPDIVVPAADALRAALKHAGLDAGLGDAFEADAR